MVLGLVTLIGEAVSQEAGQTAGGALVQTEIATMTILGKRVVDRVVIDPVGFVRRQERFYLPLLQILRALNIPFQYRSRDVLFSLPTADSVHIQVSTGKIQGRSAPSISVDIISGISDLTGEEEVFVPLPVLEKLLGLECTWDENLYAFKARARLPYEVLKPKSRFKSFNSRREVKRSRVVLPSRLGPASPGLSSGNFIIFQPGFHFIWSASGTDVKRMSLKAPDSQSFLSLLSQLRIWGRLLYGNYQLTFYRPWYFPERFENRGAIPLNIYGQWKRMRSPSTLMLGDQSSSLLETIFPAFNFRGISFQGYLSIPDELKKRLQSSRTLALGENIEGLAPAGSIVTLYVNGRKIEQQRTFPDRGLPVGKEKYRFQHVMLSPNRLNDIRIIIDHPSGYHREVRKKLIGSREMLPGGTFRYYGVVGSKRISSLSSERMQGILTAMKLEGGLTGSLTLGIIGAAQDQFVRVASTRSLFESSIQILPKRSYHAGGYIRWRPFSRLYLTGEAALSRSEHSERLQLGGTSKLLLTFGWLDLSAMVFRYQPEFFNGMVNSVFNTDGFTVSANLKPWKSMNLGYSYGKMRDYRNRWQSLEFDEDFQRFEFRLQNMLRFLDADLSMDYRRNAQMGTKVLWNYEFYARLPLNFRLSGRITEGFSFTVDSQYRFFSIPGLRNFSIFNNPGQAYSLSWDPFGSWSLQATYWATAYSQRVYGALSRALWRGPGFGLRLASGFDLKSNLNFFSGELEFAFDRSGDNRIGFGIRLDQNRWNFELTLQLRDLLTFHPGGVMRFRSERFNPDAGGIWGRIFLDKNGNGLPDRGEPGLADIPVIVEGEFLRRTRTGKNGVFFFQNLGVKDSVRVSVDVEQLPAIYVPTQGTQLAFIERGAFTPIKLGVATLVEITGRFYWPETQFGQRGIGIKLISVDSMRIVAESITARNGSFYLGNILPGRYYLAVDARTVRGDWKIELENVHEGVSLITQTQKVKQIREKVPLSENMTPLLIRIEGGTELKSIRLNFRLTR